MSNTYTDTVVNNLSSLPETIRWQNNVTRLNQTNMNTIGSAINVFTQTFTDLGIQVTNGFNNVDSDIKNLNDWKNAQLQSGDLHDYIEFRDNYQDTLQDLTTIYTNTGIHYGNSSVFKIQSQNSEIQLQGQSVRVTGPTTFEGNVNISSPLSVNSTLYTSGKTTLEDVDATRLKFGVLIDKNDKFIESFDDLQTKINIYKDPYDITKRAEYASSEEIPAVMFVQSALNVYEDYILEQVPSIEGGGVTESEVIELIKDYDSNGSSAIVYLDTMKSLDTNLELQDVYPIQTKDTFLKVVSKNMIKYDIDSTAIQGVQLILNSGKYLTIDGTATANLEVDIPISRINTNDLPGKYVLKVDNNGIDSSSEACYVLYSLYDIENNLLKTPTKLLTDAVIIDTEELGCAYIDMQVHIKCNSGITFDNQSFKIQVNYGEKLIEYTNPVTTESYTNRTIHVYTRNLYEENSDKGDNTLFKTVKTDLSPVICGVEFSAIGNRLGTHYFRGVMSEDNYIQYTENDNTMRLYTPLHKGDSFTLIYNVVDIQNNVATINNVEVVYGHSNFEKYTPCEKQTIISDAEGVCDILRINWPYSFLSLEQTSAEDEMFSILLQYDPALSRNWTEKQLSDLNKRIDTLESIIKSLIN